MPTGQASLLKNKSFLPLWVGEGVSSLGGAFGTLAISWILYELTGSPVAMGSLWLLYFLPSLVLHLGIGPYLDRWRRKPVLLVAQWVRGILFILPLGLLWLDLLGEWMIYLVAVVGGLLQSLYVPSVQAMIPRVVAKEQLTTANAAIDGTARLMTFLGPSIGGLILFAVNAEGLLLLTIVMFFSSGISLLLIREHPPRRSTTQKMWFQELVEGFHYFFGQRILLWLGIFVAVVQFGVGAMMALNLPYFSGELGGSSAAYGLFIAGFPLGYFFGSLFVGRRGEPKNRRQVMLGSLFLGGMTYLALGIVHDVKIAIAIEVFAGLWAPFFHVHSLSIFQQLVPDEQMGKVFSIRQLLLRGTIPLGILFGSQLGELWGIRSILFIIGSMICIGSLLGIFLPYFRFLNGEIEEKSYTPSEGYRKGG